MTPEIQTSTAVAVAFGSDGHRVGVSRSQPATEPVPAEPSQPKARSSEPPLQDMKQAIEQIERYLERYRNDLQFRVDGDSGRVIMSIVARKDGTVLRQIPNEDVLRIARLLAQEGQGLVDAFA